jgi:hypothetical protein
MATRYDDLESLAERADEFATWDNTNAFGNYAQGVADVLRWLKGSNAPFDLRRLLDINNTDDGLGGD